MGDNIACIDRRTAMSNLPVRLLCLAMALSPSTLLAWGQTGHRSIAEIAERNMRPDSVRKAHALLDGHDLAFASTWADEIRSDPKNYKHSFDWHYTTWPEADADFHAGLENRDTGQLLSQIEIGRAHV